MATIHDSGRETLATRQYNNRLEYVDGKAAEAYL